MAVKLRDSYVQYTTSELKNAKLSDIYVFIDAEKKYLPLSDFLVYKGDSVGRGIKNLSDFYKNLDNSNIHFKYKNGEINPGKKLSGNSKSIKLFKDELKIPSEIDSLYINGVKKDSKGKEVEDAVDFGLKRRVEMKPINDIQTKEDYDKLTNSEKEGLFNSTDYFYVTLQDGKREFVKKENLGVYNGLNFVNLSDSKSTIKSFEDLKDEKINLYYSNGSDTKLVTGMYLNGYKVGIVKYKEKLNLKERTKSTYTIQGDKVEEKEGKIDPYYSEQSFIYGDEPKLMITNFLMDEQGQYIKVRFKHEINETIIPMPLYSSSSLLKSEEIKLNDLKSYVGKVLYTKIDDEVKEIEPLTMEQASVRFSSIKNMHETTDKNDILKDGTYIRLKNGKYVEENKAVRPLAYEYADKDYDTNVYLAYCDTATGVVPMIVSKKDVLNGKNIDGYKINKEQAYPLKRSTKELKDCDVIQTTNAPNVNKIEQCEVINEPKDETAVEEATSEEDKQKKKLIKVKNAVDKFETHYIAGQYDVDDVIIKGSNGENEIVPIENLKSRYKINDKQFIDAPFAKTSQYKCMSKHDLRLENGKIKGWGHHDAKKEIKNFYSIAGGALSYLFSWYGFIGLLAFGSIVGNPVVVMSILAAVGASFVLAPAVIKIKCALQNRFKYKNKLKDPNLVNRKEFKKGFTNDLSNLLEATKTNDKRNEITFLDKISSIEESLYNMSNQHLMVDFKMQNGKANVNAGNAKLCDDYHQILINKKNELKELKKRFKTDPNAKTEYENKKQELDRIKKNFRLQNHTMLADKEFKEKKEQLELAKGYALFKYFKKGRDSADIESSKEYDLDIQEAGISAEEEFLKDYEYDVKKGEFVYIGDKKLSKEEKLAAKKKIDILKNKLINLGKSYKTLKTTKEEVINEKVEKNVLEETYKKELKNIEKHEQEKEETAEELKEEVQEENKKSKGEESEEDKETKSRRRKKNTTTEPKVPKSKLTEDNLKALLKKIEELGELDKKYYGSDEDLSGVDSEIAKLEEYIRKDSHLLVSAGKSTSDKYIKYKQRIADAEKILKDHQIFNNNRAKLKVGVSI